jgi:Reverse transcriptase (RNA-dependent DNA polymerase)
MISSPLGQLEAPQQHWLMFYITMLEDNSYVRILFIDYLRTFYTINHELLSHKLMTFDMPPNVVRWIVNFLTGHTQANCLIGQSIAQGSDIGPLLYIIFAPNLKLLSVVNVLCKYADDKILMIPEKTDILRMNLNIMFLVCTDQV